MYLLHRRRARLVRNNPVRVALQATIGKVVIVRVEIDNPARNLGSVGGLVRDGGTPTLQCAPDCAPGASGNSPLATQRTVLRESPKLFVFSIERLHSAVPHITTLRVARAELVRASDSVRPGFTIS